MQANIRIVCTNRECRTVLSVARRLEGHRVKCSCCGQMLRVPEASPPRLRPVAGRG